MTTAHAASQALSEVGDLVRRAAGYQREWPGWVPPPALSSHYRRPREVRPAGVPSTHRYVVVGSAWVLAAARARRAGASDDAAIAAGDAAAERAAARRPSPAHRRRLAGWTRPADPQPRPRPKWQATHVQYDAVTLTLVDLDDDGALCSVVVRIGAPNWHPWVLRAFPAPAPAQAFPAQSRSRLYARVVRFARAIRLGDETVAAPRDRQRAAEILLRLEADRRTRFCQLLLRAYTAPRSRHARYAAQVMATIVSWRPGEHELLAAAQRRAERLARRAEAVGAIADL